MIVVKIKGGLGNQLFQYFAGYSLARRYHQDVKYDITWFRYGSARSDMNLQKFQLNQVLSNKIDIVDTEHLPIAAKLLNNNYINKVLRELKVLSFKIGDWNYLLHRGDVPDRVPSFFENLFMDGYWQYLSWIKDYREDIRKEIRIPQTSQNTDSLLKYIHTTNSISLHVRRTDSIKSNIKIQSGDFYTKAIDYIKRKVKKPVFFVFSDDINWCKENLFNSSVDDVVFCTTAGALEDFYCMMNCKHNIIANSTFSWWAAWLNDNTNQIVITPSFEGKKDFLPEEWTIID